MRTRVPIWLLVPIIAGTVLGVAVALLPLARHVLVFVIVLSGLAWLLRAASDWVAEHAGPQKGMAILGLILFGTWFALASAAPPQLRSVGFGPLRPPSEPADPYALPPPDGRSPLASLRNTRPDQDPEPPPPLSDLLRSTPTPPPPEPPPPPPADGQRGTPRVTLRLSSSVSRSGEGVVLVAELRGDGRPVRGYVEFLLGKEVVDRRLVRVQGHSSQAEFRLVGLKPGTHTLRVRYRGSRSFTEAQSAEVQHRVLER